MERVKKERKQGKRGSVQMGLKDMGSHVETCQVQLLWKDRVTMIQSPLVLQFVLHGIEILMVKKYKALS